MFLPMKTLVCLPAKMVKHYGDVLTEMLQQNRYLKMESSKYAKPGFFRLCWIVLESCGLGILRKWHLAPSQFLIISWYPSCIQVQPIFCTFVPMKVTVLLYFPNIQII